MHDRGPPATRSNVVRLRRRLTQVQKGADLLRKKRESLVTELFDRATPAVDSRKAIEAHASVAYRSLFDALGDAGRGALVAEGWPTREIEVVLEPVDVWGLHLAEIVETPALVRGFTARGTNPTLATASPTEAARNFERLVELMLQAAPKELLLRRIGRALARTTRQVNTLEQRVAKRLSVQLLGMHRTLEEREREETIRLKRLVQKRRLKGQ